MNTQPASRQSTTPAYAFDLPIPLSVVVEENSAEAWLKWLRAVAWLKWLRAAAAMERRVNFAPTAPAPLK